jgi:hypothetical protein
MTQNLPAAIKAAHPKTQAITDQEKLETGETIWIAGWSAFSENGILAIQINDMQTIVIKETDVLEVNKDKNLFLFKIRTGTNFIHRLETISKFHPESEECNCEQHAVQTAATNESIMSVFAYTIKSRCRIVVDEDGHGHKVCEPFLSGPKKRFPDTQ